ncbi:histidinol-phosphate aminotransferase [Philodulcilactobacillus myokoensis]|uniref:Histidinol-phosphate aminotransferase n=1 Tax=Philodulcilactobacillus myokoensis TaxID=2929573 RepID=A0A9W6B394_9LACO|nr:histidinol-phosphate transaminase [Philodulcilactobacillus myokoensis]GLB47413.1 histidinol-phosphate aminotransferase [Philodulcilactobacillus myokoensis]
MKPTIANLPDYHPAQPLSSLAKQLGVKHLVRLSANENAYGTSENVKKVLLKWGLTNLNRYPDSGANQLRFAVAKHLNVDPKQLVFGDGSDEIIGLINRVFLNDHDNMVELAPTFPEYKVNAYVEGATITDVKINDNGQINLNRLADAIKKQTRLVWLCNPNNPTGRYLNNDKIVAFMDRVPKSVIVAIDEAYIDFVNSSSHPSSVDLLKRYPNLIVLRTFSKAYGLANLRIGYAVTNLPIANQLQKIRPPFNLSTVADVAGTAAISDQNFVKQVEHKNSIEIKKWEAFLDQIKSKYYPSQTNFIFFQIKDAAKLNDYLQKHGYLLNAGLRKGWLRVSMGTPKQNQDVRKLIQNFLNH